MKLDEMRAEFTAFCTAAGDPAVIAKYSRYFREGYDAYGVPDERLREVRSLLIGKYGRLLTKQACLEQGLKLLLTGKYEDGAFAVTLGKHCLKELGRADLPWLARWYAEGVTNWAISDVLCGEVLSPLLLKGVLESKDFKGWIRSASRWQRRAAAVALIPGVKKTRRVEELLPLIEPLMADGERVVHQGAGWFLRECWKVDPAATEAFLLRYKDSAPRLIYHYACEKMDPHGKERFRRAK